MIVDRIELREAPDGVERSARVRSTAGEMRLAITVPAQAAGPAADASPFLPATLLPAMCRGEDVEIDGPVSPRLIRGARAAGELYRTWCSDLRPAGIRVAEEREPDRGGRGIGCFFSRGVDSSYSAAVPRPEPLTGLVYCDGLEPRHGSRVRAREKELAAEAAAGHGLPLTLVSTNLRELTDPLIQDWEDMVGAGLAAVAAALGGAFDRVVIPSTNSLALLPPCGTSPVLDPLFSTAGVEVLHDDFDRSRVGKVAWLARERPDALGLLKVCYAEDRSDNCGRCPKCLLTMAALEAAAALGHAHGFPDAVDPAAVRGAGIGASLPARVEWAEAVRLLAPGPTRDAVVDVLREAPLPDPGAAAPVPGFRHRQFVVLTALIRDGRVWPPLDG